MKPSPREVLAHAFAQSEFDLFKGNEVERLADIALKALKEAGYGLWRRMDADDEARDEW